MNRIKSIEQLFDGTRKGNPNGGHGRIDWLNQNYCAECSSLTFKGTTICPKCHSRVRICPRKPISDVDRSIYKQKQTEAAIRLKKEGWVLPPPTIGGRSMFKFSPNRR